MRLTANQLLEEMSKNRCLKHSLSCSVIQTPKSAVSRDSQFICLRCLGPEATITSYCTVQEFATVVGKYENAFEKEKHSLVTVLTLLLRPLVKPSKCWTKSAIGFKKGGNRNTHLKIRSMPILKSSPMRWSTTEDTHLYYSITWMGNK